MNILTVIVTMIRQFFRFSLCHWYFVEHWAVDVQLGFQSPWNNAVIAFKAQGWCTWCISWNGTWTKTDTGIIYIQYSHLLTMKRRGKKFLMDKFKLLAKRFEARISKAFWLSIGRDSWTKWKLAKLCSLIWSFSKQQLNRLSTTRSRALGEYRLPQPLPLQGFPSGEGIGTKLLNAH